MEGLMNSFFSKAISRTSEVLMTSKVYFVRYNNFKRKRNLQKRCDGNMERKDVVQVCFKSLSDSRESNRIYTTSDVFI